MNKDSKEIMRKDRNQDIDRLESKSWVGALKEFKKEFSSVELQKKSLDWRDKKKQER